MGASCHACIGGTNVREDIHRLQAGVNIVVGTPGRVYDMISRRALSKLQRTVNFREFQEYVKVSLDSLIYILDCIKDWLMHLLSFIY